MEAEHGEMAKDIPNGNRRFKVLTLNKKKTQNG